MVVLFTLTVKTIRGEEFAIQTDRDADTLGLKVQIWESRNVPVDSQRLVFAGRELQDNVKLTEAGVGDGATLFMVEAAAPDVAPAAFSQPPAQNPIVAASQPLAQQLVPPVVVQIPPSQINGGRQIVGYEPLAPEVLAQERKDATFELARWIRKYILFTAFLLVVGAAMCRHGGHMLIPIFLTLLGWMGTRNLCRCHLGMYAAFIFASAAMMVLGGIFHIARAIRSHHHAWVLALVIFVGILHFCIFACLVKLMRNISRLSCDERKEVKQRIAEHRTLC